MASTFRISREFQEGFPQSLETSLTNLGDKISVEMSHIAPFANPSQYPNGRYQGDPGNLSRSIDRSGTGRKTKVTSTTKYAIRRNFENNLNPQTKGYIERSITNTLRGQASRWWRTDPSARL